MTPIELIAHLRELEAAAMPAPWRQMENGCIDDGRAGDPPQYGDDLQMRANAAFIVAMRNNLGALLTRLERLERVAEAARKLHAECPYEVDHSGRCDRNTDNRTTKLCECGTDDWVTADEAISSALDALEEE